MSDAGGGGGGGAAVPTGCYKCGRPGHWSRDCPSTNPNPNISKIGGDGKNNSSFPLKPNASGAVSKPKKAPRTRPKLTPELLLSDQGLGYILRYFPRNFKYRGRGYEVNDLRNLLRMYAEWHEQFLPYFPFDQFIHKVEEVGSSRRVKTCIAELKERVANGGDPTKLKESTTDNDNEIPHDKEEIINEEPTHNEEDFPSNEDNADDLHGDMLNEIYNKTVGEATISKANTTSAELSQNSWTQLSAQSSNAEKSSNPLQITEEQKSLMEAKRLKALERAAARSRLLPKP